MPELIIRGTKDVEKLAGWYIQEARVLEQQPPRLQMHVSHPAAEHQVELIIAPQVSLGLSGQVVVVQLSLNLTTSDIIEVKEGK